MLKLLSFAVKLAAIALVMFIQIDEARAAWGDFDTTFGFQGAAIDTVTGYHPRSVAVQPDGKILVTGYRTVPHSGERFFLRRYLSNGQLDTAFGTNGAAIGPETNTLTSDYRGNDIVVLTSGKIAVAGLATGKYAVWQFNSNGSADTAFGADGLTVLTNYGAINGGYPEINIQSGKVLLTIRKYVQTNLHVALLRLTTRGALDSTFGTAGEALAEIDGGTQDGHITVVEPDGKITIGGDRLPASMDRNDGLLRKLANGQDDTTFTPPIHYIYGPLVPGLAKLSNGKYAMRWINLAGNGSQTLVIDKFGTGGFVESSPSSYNGYPISRCPEIFTSQNDGKLVLQFAGLLFRTNNEITGSLEINDCPNLVGMNEIARGAFQPDDKMIAAGVYNNYLMLVRLLPN